MDFEWMWLFGAVNPVSGETCGLLLPECGKITMRLFLEELNQRLGENRHAILILDNASWHGKGWEKEFPNLTLLHLPPYSPELNSVERLWEWLKIQGVGNRIFETLDDLLDVICDLWRDLDPQRVQSVCRLPECLGNL